MTGLNPSGTAGHLITLDERWETLLGEYRDALEVRRRASRAHQEAYATAYLTADYTASNDAMRRQSAIKATLAASEELAAAEDEVAFKQAELRSLSARTDTARSLHAGARSATT